MSILRKVGSLSSLVFATLSANISFAASGEQNSLNCNSTSVQDDDPSRSVARSLMTQAQPYWRIATTKTADRILISRVDDPSGNGGEIDFYKVQFKRFEAGFYRASDGSVIPYELSTTMRSFKLPCGLRMGQSRKAVIGVLGAPTFSHPDAFVYVTGGDLNGEVTLKFENGRLHQVTWQYDSH